MLIRAARVIVSYQRLWAESKCIARPFLLRPKDTLSYRVVDVATFFYSIAIRLSADPIQPPSINGHK